MHRLKYPPPKDWFDDLPFEIPKELLKFRRRHKPDDTSSIEWFRFSKLLREIEQTNKRINE